MLISVWVQIKEQAIARAAKEGRKGKGCIILFAVGNDDFDFAKFLCGAS